MRTDFSVYGLRLALLLAAGCSAASALVAAPTANAVTQAWATRITSPTNFLQAGGISVGPSGDVFVAGHARSFIADNKILVSRHDAAGTLVWQKRFEPEDSLYGQIAVDVVAQGTNVYVGGTTTSTNGGMDFLTLKLRDTGELEWTRRFDGAGHSTDQTAAIAVDGQGNVILAGSTSGAEGNADITVVKYGPAGDLLWTYSNDSPGNGWDRAAGMRLDAGGNIHLAGTSVQAKANGEFSAVTIKVDPDGRELWVAREVSGHPFGINARGLDVDSAGNVVTVGEERSHCVTWKYDSNGIFQWQARYRAEEPAAMYAADVRFDVSGNVIAAANLYGSGTNDTVLIKYDQNGQQLWATRIADPNNPAHLQALAVDNEGNSILTFTPASDAVTVKVASDGVQLWSVTFDSGGFFADYGQFLEATAAGDIYVAGLSTHFSESFISLVKYTQQSVPGIPTAVVTPALQVVDPGTNVVFTAETTAAGPAQIQWRMNGRPIPDATNATLKLHNVQVYDRGDYSVVISNAVGGTVSAEARLSVRKLPEVVVDPANTIAYLGTDAAFIATVAGNDFVTLQWRHNGTNIPDATNEVLQLVNLTAAAAGAYDIVASTFGGSTTSSPARLRISRAVELVGVTGHRSSPSSWEYAPQLSVLPNGDFLIAARSNHLTQGSSILLRKHAASGSLMWSTVFDSPDFTNAEPSRLVRDAAGNIYLTGLSRQPYIPASLILLKYSPDGMLLWSRILGGTNLWGSVHSLAVDAEGSTIGILDGRGTTLIRHSIAGDVQWSIADPSQDTYTLAVAVDSSGYSYVGTTTRVGSDSEIRLRKIDPVGATVWAQPYNKGMYNWLGAIAVDASGRLIVAGTGELPEVPDSRMFVLKYSPDGEKLWETRTGSGYGEISYIHVVSIGPGDEITVMTVSDDDYTPEHSGLTRIAPNGQFRYRIVETQILVSRPSQLALDGFGNAYITGYGGRPATGSDVVTAKYDSYGNRPWLVYHGGRLSSWENGLAVGADAAGEIRVLAAGDARSNTSADFIVLHYVQRDPAGSFRLIPEPMGTFHLGVPVGESFQIEASTDLQNWNVLDPGETQQLLQPGGTAFSGPPQRFFRLIFTE